MELGQVTEVSALSLVPLRQSVLGWTEPHLDLDFSPSAKHFAIYGDEAKIVAGASAGFSDFPVEYPSRRAMRFWAVAVLSTHQNRGLGRLLMEAILSHGHSLGADAVWANARESAISYYLAMGFHEVGERFRDPLNQQIDGRVIRSLEHA